MKTYDLSFYTNELQSLLTGIENTLNLDAAIFDAKSKLIASTKNYLEQKGATVHAPSIEEVLNNGKILVNKPGFMKSCIGCRFKEDCPSKIEILNSIRIDNRPIGVITLTTFSNTGHARITDHVDIYSNILNDLSELISSMVAYRTDHRKVRLTEALFNNTLSAISDALIYTDENGSITHANDSGHHLFAFCGLYTRKIHQLLPNTLTQRILSGNSFSDEVVRINDTSQFITCQPIMDSGQFLGSVLRFTAKPVPKIRPSKTAKDHSRPASSSHGISSLKGESLQLQLLKKRIMKFADSTSTVMITGETGTGKGMVAKAIHHSSNRKDGPFISINCASIPENLFESELFGYEEGAFTGARKGGKLGQFELAQHGTLFLDEIGELPMHVQSKLLKVLQDMTIERVGGMTSIPIDVRIIAATNKDLESMVRDKAFREDLYYRLNVIPLMMAPLRERQEDIPLLAETFLDRYNKMLCKDFIGFSSQVIEFFSAHHWPGNIRELENAVEYAVNMAENPLIEVIDLPEKYHHYDIAPPQKTMEALELELIHKTLDKYGWDMKGKEKSARELGMGIRTLYRKLSIK